MVVQVDEVVDGVEHGLFQACFVRAAQWCGNQVDIAFVGRTSLLPAKQGKRGAFSNAEIAVVAV